jgi:hypothetical protein
MRYFVRSNTNLAPSSTASKPREISARLRVSIDKA